VCPGHEIDYNDLTIRIFGKSPDNNYVGNYLNIYKGRSVDREICRAASSGGVVSSLLINALRNGVIDGAIVVRNTLNEPLNPEIIIARNEEEVLEAAQSKYFPIPVNLRLSALNSDEKCALVGLPCHIEGLRKAQRLRLIQSNIVFSIGIFCGYCPGIEATRYFLYQHNIDENDVSVINYRSGDWPGRLVVQLKNGKYLYPDNSLAFSHLHLQFIPARCTLCINLTNELADISVGDAWNVHDEHSTAIVMARTVFGKELLEQASMDKYLYLNETAFDDLYKSQTPMLRYKKNGFPARRNLRKIMLDKTPVFKTELPNSNYKQYLAGLFLYMLSTIMKIRFVKRLLRFDYGRKIIREVRWYLGNLLES
jgi:coenzyme F420 hydrogenase subunit beta